MCRNTAHSSVRFCTPGKPPEKMGISPTAAAQMWHQKPVTSKHSPTPLSGLREQWVLGDPEKSFSASDTSRVLMICEASSVQVVARTSRAVRWRNKEDEHHAPVMPHCLPQGWRGCASFPQPITTAGGRADSPPCLANG